MSAKSLPIVIIAALSLILFAPACDKGAGTGQGDGGQPPVNLVGAPGVTITQVALYQGPKRTLMQDGQAQLSTIPLVGGRDALIRVYYATAPESVGLLVTGRLTIGNSAPIDIQANLTAGSTETDFASTFNFIIPGDLIPDDNFSWSVGILFEGTAAQDNPLARYPQTGPQTLLVEAQRNVFRMVIAPFQYNADGSGRLPDLSPARVAAYRERFLQLYPVSDVEITVRDPTPWSQAIEPDGTGWQGVGFQLFNLRINDNAPDDVYYYGTFNPSATFSSFCGFGCLLGVTLLNNDPPNTGDVRLRLALGVGFDEVAVDTAAHEIGHSHGRNHAPCGQGLDPQSIDGQFPYAGGGIGPWAWDIVTQTLIDPNGRTDIMGYCNNQWISDYNYIALNNRGVNVNLPRWYQPERKSYNLISFDGSGLAKFLSPVSYAPETLGGRSVEVVADTDTGGTELLEGRHFRFSHIQGGWLFVPQNARFIHRAEFVVDGVLNVAHR